MRRLAGTQATVVVAHIPDVTVIPYLTPAEDVASMIGLPLTIVGPLWESTPAISSPPTRFR
jgi:hypothetical protein